MGEELKGVPLWSSSSASPYRENQYIMARESVNEQPDAIPLNSIEIAEQDAPIIEGPPEKAAPSERREIAKSASLVMLGNLGSSIMGMVRQIVVASLGTPVAGPFNSALLPAQTFNDFLVNGSVSGALIPTFNDYAAPEKRNELRRLVFTIVNLVLLVMFCAGVAFVFISPWFVDTIL